MENAPLTLLMTARALLLPCLNHPLTRSLGTHISGHRPLPIFGILGLGAHSHDQPFLSWYRCRTSPF